MYVSPTLITTPLTTPTIPMITDYYYHISIFHPGERKETSPSLHNLPQANTLTPQFLALCLYELCSKL